MGMSRFAVIMAGGSGERFWPLSRQSRPKQLLRLTSPDQTLLEEAVFRIAPMVGLRQVYIATTLALYDAIRTAEIVDADNVWAEPDRRNTLGCLSWVAANFLAKGEDDATIAVLTADQRIGAPQAFLRNIEQAIETAERTQGLVTIGIRPTRPETGYGYIEPDRTATVDGGAYAVKRFCEKPDRATAERFVSEGFLWNSGMFFWTLPAFMREVKSALPDAADAILQMADRLRAEDPAGAADAFRSLPSTSIDYALMERSKQTFVVEGTFPWDDVGSWDALERTLPLSQNENVTIGDVIALDCERSIIYNDDPDTVACVLGVSDVVVAVADGAVLVCPKHEAQRVKEIVALLKDRGEHHRI